MSNSQQVVRLAAEVSAGVKGNALRDFKILAEANGYVGKPGGWIYAAAGGDAKAHGWAAFASLVAYNAVRLRTVQELEAHERLLADEKAHHVALVEAAHAIPEDRGRTYRATSSPEAYAFMVQLIDAAGAHAEQVSLWMARHRAGQWSTLNAEDAYAAYLRDHDEAAADAAALAGIRDREAWRITDAGRNELTTAHPVLAGQSCDASVHYTGIEHRGPLQAVRSRVSGLSRVVCTAHAERARAHGVKFVPVDIDLEHGLALDAAKAKRPEDVPDGTADRAHAGKSWTFRPTGRETEFQALSRKLREVSDARDNALRERDTLAAHNVATLELLGAVRMQRDRDASLLNNEIEALEREFRKLTERVERQLRMLDHATDRRVAAENERNMVMRQVKQLRDEKAEVVGELQELRARYHAMMVDHNHWRDRALASEDAGRASVEQHDELIAKLQAHIPEAWEASEGSGESIVLEYVEAITARLRALGGEAALARYPEDADGTPLPDAALAPVPYREAFLALLDELDTYEEAQ